MSTSGYTVLLSPPCSPLAQNWKPFPQGQLFSSESGQPSSASSEGNCGTEPFLPLNRDNVYIDPSACREGGLARSGRESHSQNDTRVFQASGTARLPSMASKASAPSSPVGGLTPESMETFEAGRQDDCETVDSSGEDHEEGDEEPQMTAEERRAAKRKMKRFRLTHAQTKYLLLEFDRQPHPDAAHRERLSREIPGLSPRQVQVWFQNRRAKSKRMSNEDRECMLRSRALPPNFDMSLSLRTPFGAPVPPMVGQLSSPGMPPGYGDGRLVRPLTIDTMRRMSDYDCYHQQYASPTGITPALGAMAFTPPHSATASSFGFQTPAQQSEWSRRYAAEGTSAAPATYTGLPQVPALDPRASNSLHSPPLRTMANENESECSYSTAYPGVYSTQWQRNSLQSPSSYSNGERAVAQLPAPTYSQYPSSTAYSAPVSQQYPTYGSQYAASTYATGYQPQSTDPGYGYP